MDNPDEVLLNIIRDNWSLSDELDKEKVVFSLTDWRVDKALQGTPNVNVDRIRFVRSGGARTRENYFIYTAEVRAIYWPKKKTAEALKDAKSLLWKMVEEIKRILGDKNNLASDWSWAQIDATVNQNVETEVPPVLIESITVNIRLFWGD